MDGGSFILKRRSFRIWKWGDEFKFRRYIGSFILEEVTFNLEGKAQFLMLEAGFILKEMVLF